MYEIELTDSAKKQYNDLPNAEINSITKAIDALEQNPTTTNAIALLS
ncbi:MAG: hypothetical protein JXK07_11625 [Spirochaetes bacterium]|nr:hypothetical protein [Spirochaetota bacterium]MBN2769883.1 hypothetical protein [Spirochaetota bacterium]